ncbi:MAG TPA: hypothetical protein VFJ62_02370 [Usitatibacter sp.]|nr:hypothetical protein [Usitatibacter sp.]
MHALFVHGMGRSPLSGWPLLWRLQHRDVATHTFGYAAAFEDFAGIERRLAVSIANVASRGEYVLIGHSLGGVLLRAALHSLGRRCTPPARVFLLGSPISPARVAASLSGNGAFRLFTGDCGQLLGSAERMCAIPPLAVPTTAIVGTLGWPRGHGPFGSEPNDGLVSVAEASAAWIEEAVQVPVPHSLLPSSSRVAALVAGRL